MRSVNVRDTQVLTRLKTQIKAKSNISVTYTSIHMVYENWSMTKIKELKFAK